ncbi:hypothetical protein Lal_00027211 [Lupinus albus]|nr:hypothetical protein Lal_00027211 [Lupinus albus]
MSEMYPSLISTIFMHHFVVITTSLPFPRRTLKRKAIIVIDPCSGVYTHAYFNHANVQEALHSNVTKLKYDWNPAMILYFQSGVIALQQSIPFYMNSSIMNSDFEFLGKVGGYAEVYNECLTFATVREAGHEVPSHQPGRALSLIMHFLNNTPLPTTKRQP